jgi:6-phosphogluconolactonase
MPISLYRYEARAAWCDAVAHFFADTVRVTAAARGFSAVVLAGGATPQPVYARLAEAPWRNLIAWSTVHFFWGDERCVPSDHPDSNYRMAHETLLSRVPVPAENIHRVPVELGAPSAIARAYEMELRAFFGVRGVPIFDLVLLGMGVDGHSASLFSGDVALDEQERCVVNAWSHACTPAVPRVTMTLPVFNHARNVAFLVAGSEKGRVMEEILRDPESAAEKYPAARIMPRGELAWFVEE